jgi:hypothetical protein
MNLTFEVLSNLRINISISFLHFRQVLHFYHQSSFKKDRCPPKDLKPNRRLLSKPYYYK